MRPALFALTIFAAAFSASAWAETSETASTEVRISGVVPTICRVAFSRASVSADARFIDLGQMSQFCNDGMGYRVTLSYGDGLTNARFLSNGVDVVLGASGEAIVGDSAGPRWGEAPARIEFAGTPPANLILNVRIEPKGVIY